MSLLIRNALIVAAHPDDEVLGVGGTIPLIKEQGGTVTVLIVTDGSTVQYAGDDSILLRKHQQAHRANNVLGTDELLQWQFPDMQLDTVAHFELNQALEKLIQERQFDTVFVQNSSDINLDHQLVHQSVLVATRPFPNQPVRQVLSYYVNSSTEWGQRSPYNMFWPNVFIDITTTIDLKLKAMSLYEDELREYPHPRSIQSLRNHARVFGNQVGYEYAEPFSLLLMRGSLDASI